jgi:hypothetical protein
VKQVVKSKRRARQSAHVGALWGLGARGLLYLVLAALTVNLVAGGAGSEVDARGALHQLAHDSVGRGILLLLAVGFAGFALWHLYLAALHRGGDHPAARRLADAGRGLLYAALCALAVSFLTTSTRAGNSDRTDKTWTAKLLSMSGGRVIVGLVAVAIISVGVWLVWRAVSGREQDEPAVREAAPREPLQLRILGVAGNLARGGVVVLIGGFLMDAAIQHDANQTVGLDGALTRLLDGGVGDALVLLVGLGFAMFGGYSVARAWVNRRRPARAA